jgi:hypothetical protein
MAFGTTLDWRFVARQGVDVAHERSNIVSYWKSAVLAAVRDLITHLEDHGLMPIKVPDDSSLLERFLAQLMNHVLFLFNLPVAG